MSDSQNPSIESLFVDFVERSRKVLSHPGARAEQSIYPLLDGFLSDAALVLGVEDLSLIQQANAGSAGVPDFRCFRHGESLGWIELKAVTDKPLSSLKGHDRRQLTTYRSGLHNWILTNGYEWWWFKDSRRRSRVNVGPSDLFDLNALPVDPGDLDVRGLESLLRRFLDSQPRPYDSAEAAVSALANRARALRLTLESATRDGAGAFLNQLESDFKALLYRSGQPFTWERFVDSYAQLAVFGTLLWRLETGHPISLATHVGVDPNLHPLLTQCLTILWNPSAQTPELTPLLEELCTTINLIDPSLFEGTPDGHKTSSYVPDPIVEAYEPFFAHYDPAARETAGVYYTPAPIVSCIVDGAGWLLRESLGSADGLLDPDARFIDPATGTGTFLLGLANAVAKEAGAQGLPVDAMVRQVIEQQTSAFELFPGPYAIAHQRVEAALRTHGANPSGQLPIFLADTLAAPSGGELPLSGFGPAGAAIRAERERADAVKDSTELILVFGNPPYERVKRDAKLEPFATGLLEILRKSTPAAARKNLKSTRDLYVMFWLWALWALQPPDMRRATSATPAIETSKARGIVAYITNRTWIHGESLAGLRRLVRQGASEIWILDLGGDARGAHGANSFAGGDANVFGIQTGVAICWAVFDASDDEPPIVRYHRLYGSKNEKLAYLEKGIEPTAFQVVDGSDTDPFVPVNWHNDVLAESPTILELFVDPPAIGFQTARESKQYPPVGTLPTEVYAVSPGTKDANIRQSAVGSLADWARLRKGGAEQRQHWETAQSQRSGAPMPDPDLLDPDRVVPVCYGPLDYRYLYLDSAWVDWDRPDLRAIYEDGRLRTPTLVSIPHSHGRGPSVVYTERFPNQHAFRGSAGGNGVFPLWRPVEEGAGTDPRLIVDAKRAAFSSVVVDWLETIDRARQYDSALSYLLCILSAPTYTAANWQALEVDWLRAPLTDDVSLFDRAASLGNQLRTAWNAEAPVRNLRWLGNGVEPFGAAKFQESAIVFENGRSIEGVSEAAWSLEVSGYYVLREWFAARSYWQVSASTARAALATVSGAQLLTETLPECDLVLSALTG